MFFPVREEKYCDGQLGLVGLGRLPTLMRGTPIINPWAGDAHQPWLASQLGEENSDFKSIAKGLDGTVPAC